MQMVARIGYSVSMMANRSGKQFFLLIPTSYDATFLKEVGKKRKDILLQLRNIHLAVFIENLSRGGYIYAYCNTKDELNEFLCKWMAWEGGQSLNEEDVQSMADEIWLQKTTT